MPPLCEDRLEVLVVWEAAVAHNDASSYVSQQMMASFTSIPTRWYSKCSWEQAEINYAVSER